MLTELVLDPPAHSLEPKELYLATTAELRRRLSRVYTTIGTQDPSTGTSACRLIHVLHQVSKSDQAMESSGRRTDT
ncbi:hypothetical protein ACIBW9_33660 [Streptomyces sp. NPDC049541]|uniref:hypothetical protein n=1 Tax=Streptomyces sp. NPDC049541 TaxID=3365594 RepID=UPI00379AF2F2